MPSDLKNPPLTSKSFNNHREFYSDIFLKTQELEPEVFYSSQYSFIKVFKETQDFLKKFLRKNQDNFFVNKALFMVGLMKVHQFCLKNILLALKKKNLEASEIIQKLSEVFSENFNAFIKDIKGRFDGRLIDSF